MNTPKLDRPYTHPGIAAQVLVNLTFEIGQKLGEIEANESIMIRLGRQDSVAQLKEARENLMKQWAAIRAEIELLPSDAQRLYARLHDTRIKQIEEQFSGA